MATALSSLRVTSDFDASGYARGAAQKVAADAQMIASDKARNASLALADAALAKVVPGMTSVSKALLDGYGAGAQFAAIITRIGNAVDRGMGLDRANLLLDAAYQKFGLTADAATLAEKGFVSIADAVGVLNDRYAQLELAAASAAETLSRTQTQAGINQSFGINVAPAKSAQDSADAFMAAFGGLDGIAAAKAKEAGAAFSADLDASMIAGTSKSAKDSAAVFLEAAQAEEAFAAQAAALRAQIDPMSVEFAAVGKQAASYRALLDEGVISANEYAAAQSLLATRLETAQRILLNTEDAGRISGSELTNLSYQLNDIVTGLAMGQSPLMILAQQGGQVAQIFQTSKAGISDFASAIGSKFLDLLTVSRVAWGGIAGAVGVGIAALVSFQSKQQAISLALTGAGRASGSTVNGIMGIGEQAASTSGLSVNEATEFASALAQTGKVANDNILPIVQMGKDISRVFGTDAADSAKLLANAFADPVKGADDLNQRLGFLDASTKQNIANLVAQNNTYAAQQVLIEAVKGSLTDVSQAVSTSTSAWTTLGNVISNAWTALGRFIAGGSGVNTIESQLAAAQQKLKDLQATGGLVPDLNTGGMTDAGGVAAIAAAQAAVDRLTAALQREKTATDQAREAQQSLAQAQAIRSAIPLIGQTQDLQNQLTLLQNLANAPDVNDRLVKTGQSLNDLQRAIAATGAALQALPKNALVDFLGAAATPAQKLDAQIEQLRAKGAQIGASPAQLSQAVGAASLESTMVQQQMRQNALGGAKQSLEALKQRQQATEELRDDDRSKHHLPAAA